MYLTRNGFIGDYRRFSSEELGCGKFPRDLKICSYSRNDMGLPIVEIDIKTPYVAPT